MPRFCKCKYSFKLTFRCRKLEFYTDFIKKMYLLLLFKSLNLGHLFMIILQSKFFMKHFFFLIPTLTFKKDKKLSVSIEH